jgi:hypothetical protein
MAKIGSLAASCVATAAILFPGFAASSADLQPIPDFSGLWTHSWKLPGAFEPPLSGPGPVRDDPKHPHRDNGPWAADWSNPILKPQTRARLQRISEGELNGNPHTEASTRCEPPGVPSILGMRDDMEVVQTKDKVLILYTRDHQVRRVYLNVPHSKQVKTSWLGESVGHYEGDTLVIDTIGQNDKTETDRFGTPHSDKIHVVERYRHSPDKKRLELTFTVEDPGAFTMPWSARTAYVRDNYVFEENVCAENNFAHGLGDEIAMPVDDTPDF